MATDVTTSTVVSYTAFPPLRSRTVTRKASLPRYAAFAACLPCSVTYFAQARICHSQRSRPSHCYAVYLCCTILGVTSTRRYLASCPVKPGLSSPMPFRLHGSDHPFCSLEGYSNIKHPNGQKESYAFLNQRFKNAANKPS